MAKKAKSQKEKKAIKPAEKRPVGRPTNYRPEYCQLVLDMMGEGKSIAAVAAELGVGRAKLFEWAKAHEDFRSACDAGKEAAQKWWENLGNHVASGEAASHKVYKKANQGMIMFMMSRRFPDYYAKNRSIIETNSQEKPDLIRAMSRSDKIELIKKYRAILDQLESEDELDA